MELEKETAAHHASDGDMDVQKPLENHIEQLRREQTHHAIPPALHARLNRKFDVHVVPFLFGIWLCAFIDRSNIGNAKIDGLTADLHIATGTRFNIALLVFYIPYILVDVPSNWLLKRARAGRYLPALSTAWGLVSTFLGFTRSFAGLVVARLFLGALEGGLLGGIIVYLAMFYRRHELLWRMGLFYCAAPLSGAFGGLLATGLARIEYGGYNRWPWIFFIEGIITVLFGVTCFYFMPNTPADATFLTQEERIAAMARLKDDAHGATDVEDVNEERFHWHWVRMAFSAPQTWLSSLIWFFVLIPLYVRTAPCSRTFSLSVIDAFYPLNTTNLTELLSLPTHHHYWSGLHQHHHGTALHRAAQHGRLCCGPTDLTPIGQDQGARTHHGGRLRCRDGWVYYASGSQTRTGPVWGDVSRCYRSVSMFCHDYGEHLILLGNPPLN